MLQGCGLPSSNSAEVYCFFCKKYNLKRTKMNKKGPGLAHFTKKTVCSISLLCHYPNSKFDSQKCYLDNFNSLNWKSKCCFWESFSKNVYFSPFMFRDFIKHFVNNLSALKMHEWKNEGRHHWLLQNCIYSF